MIDRKVSIRYARALDKICRDNQLAHRDILEVLKSFYHAVNENDTLKNFLNMSIIPTSKKIGIVDKLISDEGESYIKQFIKKNIMDRIFSDSVKAYSKQFIEYVIKKNRFMLFGEILEIFEEIVDKKDNILKASVVSAVELDEITKGDLKEHLESKFNKTIEVSFSVDNSLIAGIVVQIDDVVYDGSMSTYLNNLERRLLRLPL